MKSLIQFEEKYKFFFVILRGISQIMLQNNPLTGILFIIGVLLFSINMALGLILGSTFGFLSAKLLKYDETDINSGIYGFSASLVGAGLIFFFETNIYLWIFIIIGSFLATFLQHFFIVKKIPVFTLPFVLITWLFLYIINNFLHFTPSIYLNYSIDNINQFAYALLGFGQVIFINNIISSLIFFIAIYISSPISALYSLLAAVFSGILATLFLIIPEQAIASGLFSYNAILCAIVFADIKLSAGFWVIISTILATIISVIMYKFQLIALTFPFVLATMITIFIKNLINKKIDFNN